MICKSKNKNYDLKNSKIIEKHMYIYIYIYERTDLPITKGGRITPFQFHRGIVGRKIPPGIAFVPHADYCA